MELQDDRPAGADGNDLVRAVRRIEGVGWLAERVDLRGGTECGRRIAETRLGPCAGIVADDGICEIAGVRGGKEVGKAQDCQRGAGGEVEETCGFHATDLFLWFRRLSDGGC